MQGDTADRILETARTLIAELGYSGFSYADISEKVQIRKASIHHHFPTKVSLVVAVLRAHRAGFMQGTDRLTEEVADPVARLGSYVQYWAGCLKDKSQPFCIAALLAAELPSLPEEVRAEVHRHFVAFGDWICGTLEEGVQKGLLTLKETPEDEAQMFMAAVHGAMLSARALGSCDVFEAVTTGALQRLSPVRP